MEIKLRIFLLIGIAVYFLIIFYLLRKARLALRYSLMWIMSGILMLFFAIFPGVVFRASALIGVSDPVNAVFMLFAGFTIILLLALTSIVSKLSDENRRLIQSTALLEERVRRLEGGSRE